MASRTLASTSNMESDNLTQSATEPAESPVGEAEVAGQNVDGDSSGGSPKCLPPTKGSDVQESSSSTEESHRREQQDVAAGVDRSGTGTNEMEGVIEMFPVGGQSSSTTIASEQDVSESTAGSSNSRLAMRERWMISDTARTFRKQRRGINIFTVFDDCMEQVEKASVGMRTFFMEVLDGIGTEKRCRMFRDYKGPSECSLFQQRYKAVEDYFRSPYHSFAAQMDVTGSPFTGSPLIESPVKSSPVKKASRCGSTSKSEGNKKRKSESDVEGLELKQDVEKPVEIAVGRPKGECAGSSVQKELGDACTTKRQRKNTECDMKMSSVGALTSASFVSSKKDADLTRGHEMLLHNIKLAVDSQVRKLKLACDIILTSAKCVAFVASQALKTHALCPVLLKLAEITLDEDKFRTVQPSISLATRYAGLALEAVETAVEYHKSAANYLAEVLEPATPVQASEVLREEVLSQVIDTTEELEELEPLGPDISPKEAAEMGRTVQAMARVLSPALRRVKEANAFTKDVADNFDRALLYKAMGVTLKGATYYSLFVISEAMKVLGKLAGGP